ncbi:MAG: hypothetical protein RIR91_1750 [Verrucomicrobiota bacterium]
MPRFLLLCAPLWAFADTVTLTDGTFLRGKIERAAEGQLEMTVPALGGATQRIPLAKVESFRTDDAVAISMGGVVQRGLASASAGRVASSGGAETCELSGKFELWREPAVRPLETRGQRKWTLQADFDLSGRSGVTQGSGFSAGLQAKGVHDADTILASIRVVRSTAGSLTSADDLHLNLAYETNPTNIVFWYARTDSGYDNARLVDFFSVNAAGLGLRLYTDGAGKLDARIGLAHRTERYATVGQPNLSAPSADLGLVLTRELGWAAWDSSVSIVPSFQKSGDYYIRHESTLSLLRGAGPLSLRLGVSNDFRSQPQAGQVKLDTAYFARLTYVWK